MMAIWTIISIFYLLLLPLLQCTLGHIVIKQFYRLFRLEINEQEIDLACAFVLGLLTHMFIAFFLMLVGANWWLASFIPLAPLCFNYKLIARVLDKCWPQPSPNFLIWFFIIVGLGLSVIGFNGEISTAWSNNYGDVAFHIGMINSFVFGDNFPPQYHIYAGETLSYPFLINFWTALLWWLQPELDLLPFVFLVQWTLVWLVVYHFVNGAKYFLLPWTILFGGGTYYLLGEYSYRSLNEGYPWVAFLGSIWIPQRTFLLGLVGILFIVWVAYRGLTGKEPHFLEAPRKASFLRATIIGLFSGLALLMHGHAILVAGLFIGLSSAIFVVQHFVSTRDRSRAAAQMEALLLVLLTATLAFAFVSPWLLAKSNMFDWMPGWLVNKKGETTFQGLTMSAKMWFLNAGYCIVLFFPIIVLGKYVRESITLLVIFLLFNFIRLAHWDWDQIKLFITLYVIMIAVWSFSSDRLMWRLHLVSFILLIPGASEAFKTFSEGPYFTVYSKQVIEQARKIREHTPPDSIIAAATDHNSLVTLTGRKLYTGYPGTTWTHGIKSQDRETLLKNLPELIKCKQNRGSDKKVVCPDYIAWSPAEMKLWENQNPRALQLSAVVPNLLYKLPE